MKPEIVGFSDVKHIIEKIKRKLPPYASDAYIFGSLARNYAIRFESDVGLLIIPKRHITLEKIYEVLKVPWRDLMDKRLVLHIILFDPKRHPKDLLETARKGFKIL